MVSSAWLQALGSRRLQRGFDRVKVHRLTWTYRRSSLHEERSNSNPSLGPSQQFICMLILTIIEPQGALHGEH